MKARRRTPSNDQHATPPRADAMMVATNVTKTLFSCITLTMEETQTRHRKEVKSLEGEKRAALKKAKGTKGKKAKEAVAS